MKQIAWNYVTGNLIVDLLATIPIDLIAEAIAGHETTSLSFFGLFKIGRLLRLSKIIEFLNTSRDFKVGAKMINLIFFLVIYLHCFACALWIFVVQDR